MEEGRRTEGQQTHHVEVLETLVEADSCGQAILHSWADDDVIFVCELCSELGCCSVDHFRGLGVVVRE